jgi:hypothetical protein
MHESLTYNQCFSNASSCFLFLQLSLANRVHRVSKSDTHSAQQESRYGIYRYALQLRVEFRRGDEADAYHPFLLLASRLCTGV